MKTGRIKHFEVLEGTSAFPYEVYVSGKHIHNVKTREEAIELAKDNGARKIFIEHHEKVIEV